VVDGGEVELWFCDVCLVVEFDECEVVFVGGDCGEYCLLLGCYVGVWW